MKKNNEMLAANNAPRYFVVKNPGEAARLVEVSPRPDRRFPDIQALVGGYVEPIDLGKAMLLMHDSGRLLRLPVNVIVPGRFHPIGVVGPIVIADRFNNDPRGLDRDAAERWRLWADSHAGTDAQAREAFAAAKSWLLELKRRNPHAIVMMPRDD